MGSGAMRLYDRDISALRKVLRDMNPRRLPDKKSWNCTDQEALVLRSDMAFELGGGGKEAVSGLAFTTDISLLAADMCDAEQEDPRSPRRAGLRKESFYEESGGVFLAGKDLPEIREDVSYARITLLCLDGLEGLEPQQLYSVFRRIEYTRYHIYPEGYMMRISAVKEREPVRISRQALRDGMDFAQVGACFAEQYKRHPQVRAVRTYFVTDPAADYGLLWSYAHRFEQITESANQVFRGFSMDCTTCGQRQLCQEIDGLRELHRGMG